MREQPGRVVGRSTFRVGLGQGDGGGGGAGDDVVDTTGLDQILTLGSGGQGRRVVGSGEIDGDRPGVRCVIRIGHRDREGVGGVGAGRERVDGIGIDDVGVASVGIDRQ